MAELLANIPWWILAGLVLAGAVMLVHGNRANKSGLRTAGISVLSLALLLGAAHFLIDTPAERAERMTRQIVDAADKADWPRLRTLLDANTDAEFTGLRPEVHGGDAIAQTAQAAAHTAGLTSAAIWSLRAEQAGDQITITFVAYTMQEQSQGRPVTSNWQFDWRVIEGRPHLTKITLLSFGNQQ